VPRCINGNSVRIIVFGANGRVGSCVVTQAVGAGHNVTAFVRDRKKLPSNVAGVSVVEGDALSEDSVGSALGRGFDAVVSAIGVAGGLARTTLVTDATRVITAQTERHGTRRYLAVSGIAEMKQSFAGNVTIAILRTSPIGNAIRDHDGAFEIVTASGLDWTLAGCGYIQSGPRRNTYKTSLTFPGGFKIVHPPDVANLIVRELTDRKFVRQVVGIWY
jgi:putative NADH-flavin reductase